MAQAPRPLANWPAFLGGVVATLVLPLLPLLFEQFANNAIQQSSWAIAAAMYAIGNGASSRMEALFWIYILITICMSFVYGMSMSGRPLPGMPIELPKACVAFVFLAHLFDALGNPYEEPGAVPAVQGTSLDEIWWTGLSKFLTVGTPTLSVVATLLAASAAVLSFLHMVRTSRASKRLSVEILKKARAGRRSRQDLTDLDRSAAAGRPGESA
jgi:hypothetical protein